MPNLVLRLLGLSTDADRRRNDVEYAEDRSAAREVALDAYYRAGVE